MLYGVADVGYICFWNNVNNVTSCVLNAQKIWKKNTTFILAFYSNDDSWKVLDENIRILNSLFQGCSI